MEISSSTVERNAIQGLDMEELKARIRRGAAWQRDRTESPAKQRGFASINWPQVNAWLNTAAQNAIVGTTLPTLGRFRGLKRRLAQWAAQVVLYLAQFITIRQRQFNFSLLQSTRILGDGLRSSEKRFNDQEARIVRLEKVIVHLQAELAGRDTSREVLASDIPASR